jgi:hypothetical protein
MITIEEMKKIVATMTYKPKATIDIRQSFADEFPMLEIALRVVDAIDMVSATKFHQRERIPGRVRVTEETFIDWVFRMIVKAERHEVMEFFRVKDKHWIEPHPKESESLREIEQRRYMNHKLMREHTDGLNRRAMEINPDVVSLYGFGGPPEKYNYDEAYFKSKYEEYKVPSLSQEQLDKMMKDIQPIVTDYQKKTKFLALYGFGPKAPLKATPEGKRKKAKRARAAHKKGFSNKPWDALRK